MEEMAALKVRFLWHHLFTELPLTLKLCPPELPPPNPQDPPKPELANIISAVSQ